MAADSQGNDITQVFVPVTGFIGVAPFGTDIPTPVEGAAEPLVLDAAFKKIGLLKTDGGPQWAWESTGDAIEFWQDGYSLPSGLSNVTLAITAAQTDPWVRELMSGQTPDANGYINFDGGGHATQYVVFTEEISKSGAIRRRVAANVQVQSVVEDRSTRGEVQGYAITFKVSRSAATGNAHFGEWVLAA